MNFKKKSDIKSIQGQGLTEYSIILTLVAVASIAGAALFGGAIRAKIASLTGAISGQKISDIQKSDKRAKSAADMSLRSSKKIHSMEQHSNKNSMDDGNSLFESIDLN